MTIQPSWANTAHHKTRSTRCGALSNLAVDGRPIVAPAMCNALLRNACAAARRAALRRSRTRHPRRGQSAAWIHGAGGRSKPSLTRVAQSATTFLPRMGPRRGERNSPLTRTKAAEYTRNDETASPRCSVESL